MDPQKTMAFTEHFAELKKRLLKIFAVLVCGTFACLIYSPEIFHIIQRPLLVNQPAGSGFIALSPIEGWMVYLKLSFVASVFLTAPVWFYEMWAFLKPAFSKGERRTIIIFGIISSVFFIAGGLFCYFAVMPSGFRYLAAIYNNTGIELQTQMSWYLSFVLRCLLTFGVIFETPVLMVLLTHLNILSVDQMKKARRYVIVGAFIVGAVATPGPDVVSQIIVAAPIILFYEAGIVLAAFFKPRQTEVVSSRVV